jgi:hypothetical protein
MATYRRDIQPWVRATYGFTPETCWIADVKSAHGLTTRIAPNRADLNRRVRPCPLERRAAIEAALRHLGMI